ncbi:hypothetical protein [Rhodopirellula sp. MGV]|uniref:hypothetical protein n=1 Tax=Rhodopirellula sp. MGV TaxID=2023130 RepID=UPI000B96564D|nr:hypothetical protein [Rhodopirellula sp. MGV]OYP37537.1 hypothetical protein CGZ80_05295 [Rhodopirellula sp. MGV]PNY37942.1 hypothetical protein C2E31_05435 [Rhodopirellula baltica]
MSQWQSAEAVIVQGHRVASGMNGNPRFPNGTLRMQMPYFKSLGLDLSPYFIGTINLSIAPLVYQVVQPRVTFRDLKWHPVEPAEDFSFFDAKVEFASGSRAEGLIYFPHPDTKPEHFQAPDVLELLLPKMENIEYGGELVLSVPGDQMRFGQA